MPETASLKGLGVLTSLNLFPAFLSTEPVNINAEPPTPRAILAAVTPAVAAAVSPAAAVPAALTPNFCKILPKIPPPTSPDNNLTALETTATAPPIATTVARNSEASFTNFCCPASISL